MPSCATTYHRYASVIRGGTRVREIRVENVQVTGSYLKGKDLIVNPNNRRPRPLLDHNSSHPYHTGVR